MTIQPQTLVTIGILLLALVTVETGGMFLTYVSRGAVPTNGLQKSFYRAGHAHAAVLLILGMVIVLVLDQINLSGFWKTVGGSLVPVAAILMPAGFFLSVIGDDPRKPNRLIVLLWLGVASLTIGLVVSGVAVLTAGLTGL